MSTKLANLNCSLQTRARSIISPAAPYHPRGCRSRSRYLPTADEGGITGTQCVIDSINKSGTVKRLIYTSSMAAVQNGIQGPDHEWTETVRARPSICASATIVSLVITSALWFGTRTGVLTATTLSRRLGNETGMGAAKSTPNTSSMRRQPRAMAGGMPSP